MKIYVGTSGWQYKHWNAAFYPKKLKGTEQLTYFAERFNTVEVNSSFYRIPSSSAVQGWHDRTPASFKFAVKLNNYLTHSKKLILDKKSQASLQHFIKNTTPLDKKLAAILVQLPPSLKANPERLDEFLSQLRKLVGHTRVAVEFRHDSWQNGEVYKILKGHKAALVVATYPEKFKPPEFNQPFLYVRFHATPERPNYPNKQLDRWAKFIKSSKCRQAFVYFNNDYEACAIKNAAYLEAKLI